MAQIHLEAGRPVVGSPFVAPLGNGDGAVGRGDLRIELAALGDGLRREEPRGLLIVHRKTDGPGAYGEAIECGLRTSLQRGWQKGRMVDLNSLCGERDRGEVEGASQILRLDRRARGANAARPEPVAIFPAAFSPVAVRATAIEQPRDVVQVGARRVAARQAKPGQDAENLGRFERAKLDARRAVDKLVASALRFDGGSVLAFDQHLRAAPNVYGWRRRSGSGPSPNGLGLVAAALALSAIASRSWGLPRAASWGSESLISLVPCRPHGVHFERTSLVDRAARRKLCTRGCRCSGEMSGYNCSGEMSAPQRVEVFA